jgi:glutathione peroxidase
MTAFYEFTVQAISGAQIALSKFRGNVILVVNTASKCGFTPQYEDLQQLHLSFANRGLAILGFPCDQFAHQEPGSAAEIESFCRLTYDVQFPMFAKVQVNGAHTDPLYRWLKKEARGFLGSQSIKWNFTKFLIDREGRVVARFPPTKRPKQIEPAIVKLLQASDEA